MSRDGVLKEELLETHDGLRRLHEEHLECERQLEALVRQSNLSQEDEVEQKRLKLRKLALKDQMERILRDHKSAGVPV